MKNKRILFEYAFKPIIYFIISGLIGFGTIYVIYSKLINMYIDNYSKIPRFIISSVNIFLYIKNNFLGNLIYLILIILIVIPIYLLLMKKKINGISEIINTTNIMANGDLNQTIQTESKDEIEELANNINSIVSQLRNITIEERRAQQTKTDLITNVSHDLRTPLTSIIGYLGLIEEDKYKDEVELRYYTTIAYEKSKNLNILINDLFELTKMQNNTIRLDKIDINLVELLGQIVSQFEYEFSKENVKVRTDFSEDRLLVNVDPSKLVRAFENLINNAMKYGNDGKYIDVETRKQDNMAIVKIINYGEPIPSLDLPHIFDRFYRVEKSRNRNDGGSGLGLAITKNIIDLHGGSIEVKSDSISTIFEIRLKLI